MDLLLFSFNAISPLILIVALGYILQRVGIIDDHFVNKANILCFKVAFPVQLFKNIYEIDFQQDFNPALLGFAITMVFAVVFATLLLAPRFIHSRAQRGAFIQAVFRGNFLLLGLALANNLFGVEGTAPASMLLPVVIPLYNLIAVVLLTYYAAPALEQSSLEPPRISIRQLGLELVKNPLLDASLLAMALSLAQVPLPPFVRTTATDIGKLATPLALLLLGGQFKFQSLEGKLRLALAATALRIVLLPLLITSLAVLAGFRGPELGALFVLFSSPTAITSFIMAKNMASDAELTGQIVVLTTMGSGITLFIGVLLLKSFQLI
ncbi:AEC family transporter [Anaerotalea alkaliphila]|uniref:AEC family transporter n=1 Tax=Anaerotalea alkaliphila TaxID=2662126 RepID=A0A7X5HVF7_9FIRM|nr:AEC family transporter [Anaerotalea alkaliphila]NDL67392.1 AEC family transporter [Anaerotalea alkaliphila]